MPWVRKQCLLPQGASRGQLWGPGVSGEAQASGLWSPGPYAGPATSCPSPQQGQKMEEFLEGSLTRSHKPGVFPGASPLPSPRLFLTCSVQTTSHSRGYKSSVRAGKGEATQRKGTLPEGLDSRDLHQDPGGGGGEGGAEGVGDRQGKQVSGSSAGLGNQHPLLQELGNGNPIHTSPPPWLSERK